MAKVKLRALSDQEQQDLRDNLHLLAHLLKFVSRGLNLPKQELLTQIRGKLVDVGEMVVQNETVDIIEIDLTYSG